MSTELLALLLAALICLLLPLVYSFLYQRQVGVKGTMGNRETVAPPTGAAARGLRAHQNLLENLLPFAIVVLAAQYLAVTNALTVAGALLFLGARVVHALCYLFGVTVIRSLAYLAGLIGTLMIGWQLF